VAAEKEGRRRIETLAGPNRVIDTPAAGF